MDPVRMPSANMTLTLSETDEGVGDLPAEKATFNDERLGGVPGFETHWRPSEEELEQLNAGATVRLTVIGDAHPPVEVGVGWKETVDPQTNGGAT